MGAWQRLKPYLPSILIPTGLASLIYADLRHTRLWKESLAEKNLKSELQQ